MWPRCRTSRRSANPAGQRLLVRQQQRLVAGVEAGALQLRHGVGSTPQASMKSSASPMRSAVSANFAAQGLRPMWSSVHCGPGAGWHSRRWKRRAAGSASPPTGHRRCSIRCGSLRRASAVELDAVDDVAEIARHSMPPGLGRRRARLGELAGHAARPSPPAACWRRSAPPPSAAARGRCRGCCRVELGEAFRAVAALQQETLAGRHFGKVGLERARLAGKDQRRELGQRLLDAFHFPASS
jgi:hypothetical protein